MYQYRVLVVDDDKEISKTRSCRKRTGMLLLKSLTENRAAVTIIDMHEGSVDIEIDGDLFKATVSIQNGKCRDENCRLKKNKIFNGCRKRKALQ
ncbi:hypothetical protein [Paenibacillus thermotolerans]|uniref:hypothetical protein n=1 Tax=Paenibacillus thermotolerans TaxID=3027807 RepID=UPI002368AD0D|nr:MULTISPECIES: hypothetical protein [unclassified Paenibacillus]